MATGLDKREEVFYMGIVKDGVRCGDNKICMNQTCRDISGMIQYTRCPQAIPPRGGKMEECALNGVSLSKYCILQVVDDILFLEMF